MPRTTVAATLAIATLIALIALGATATSALGSDDTLDDERSVAVQLRIWEGVRRGDIWVSARPEGGSWGTLGTFPFALDEPGPNPYRTSGVLAVAGVELRISNHLDAGPASIEVYACGSFCADSAVADVCEWDGITLPLDDGTDSSGHYRYGELTIEVQQTNPRLVMDRERLLALRDTLAGSGTLDWSADRDLADWAGVTVEGAPARVTKLRLANSGLSGELSGLLGDLTALTELRLEGNALSGGIPSKLTQLPNLEHLYLGENALQGCVPPALREVANTDLGSLPLPDCEPPVDLWSLSWPRELTEGAYHIGAGVGSPSIIFDVPAGADLRLAGVALNGASFFVLEHETGPWLGMEDRRCGPVRVSGISRRSADIGAVFDRVAESRWWGVVE